MTNLQEARANSLLNKEYHYEHSGVMTARAWIEAKLAEGYTPTIRMVPDTAEVKRLESELARLRFKGEPSGNPNWPDTKRYYSAKTNLTSNPTKPDYRLTKDDSLYSVTKTEYEYAVRKTNVNLS